MGDYPKLDPKLEEFIYQEIDGHWVFDTPKGFLTLHDLKQIVDTMRRRNIEVDIEYEKYLNLRGNK
jgi:hypothetical protein